ncbi:LysM peptidoglycan-binding domain-containing protein [Anaeromicropila herbilytica]|uniref:LysM domain-containing protein n=1 Tax=Anaeromicropila herbilytica TaxID=2785025 RepID=A0A7R7EPD4_9FIRM|nr:LysM peptidoglycan-binding domain-containing protein [Anaeromicropila herbilytica]BCN32177.1 hypothetical protein bsdtb5_34720 [Anaeromicropila herbilytica]
MAQNDFFDELNLKLKEGKAFADIIKLQESRYSLDDNLMKLRPSVLSKIKITNGSVTKVNTERTMGEITFLADLHESELKRLSEWLGLDNPVVKGTISVPGVDGYSEFDLNVQGGNCYNELFAPLAIYINSFIMKLKSHCVDNYSDKLLSSCELVAMAKVEGLENEIQIRANGIERKDHIQFVVEFAPELSIKNGTTFIMNLFGIKEEIALPDIFDIAGVKELMVQIANPYATGTLKTTGLLESAGLVITTREEYKPSIPFLKLTSVTTNWDISFTKSESNQTNYVISGSLLGKYNLGKEDTPLARLTTSLHIPSLEAELALQEDTNIPLGSIMKEYLGIPAESLEDTLIVTRLEGNASVMAKEFSLDMEITNAWNLLLGNVTLSLENITAYLGYYNNQLIGSFEGNMSIDDEEHKAVLQMTAEYENPAWKLSGGLSSGSLNIPTLIVKFTETEPPEWLKNIDVEIKKLWLELSTEEGHPFHLTGELEAGWKIDVLGKRFVIGASVDYERKKKGTSNPSVIWLTTNDEYDYKGNLTGNLKFGTFLVKVGTKFSNDSKPMYEFYLSYQNKYLQASTVLVKNKDNTSHQALKLSLGGATFGELLAYLFHLINPNLDIKLPPPWNVLDSIKLSDFEFTLDPTLKKYSIEYKAKLNIGIANIDTVGLSLDESSQATKLNVILTGDLLGKKYTESNPLEWDTVNENAPEAPGTGKKLCMIYYLGMGQYIKPSTDTSSIKSVKDMIDLWKKALPAGGEGFKNPVKGESKLLAFDETVDWMVGIDMAVLEFLRMRILFQDPDFYGAQITLNGAQAGSLSGLNLEILYKKIRDNIGMFKTRLLLPEAFRRFELGIFSVTLGMIDVEIYTNGNFMVDFGFPHNGDFTNSFNIQAAWWTGDGGIYFGVLSSETTNLVPKVSNGRFAPVIALGIGFRFGIGRSINSGILKAEASLQLLAILEGVFAVYQPNDLAKKKEYYYLIKGTVGIIGKVYAEVNFAVIQVALNLEVKATASIIVEAYEKILLSLALSILAQARVKILFVRISFEFKYTMRLDLSFGEKRLAPWQSGNMTTNQTRALNRNAMNLLRKDRSLLRVQSIREWNPNVSLDLAKKNVNVNLVPVFSIDQAEVTRNNTPTNKLAFLLFIDQTEIMNNNKKEKCFHYLVELMTRWSLSVLEGLNQEGSIDVTQLKELSEWFDTKEAKAGFTKENLSILFENYMMFNLRQVPIITTSEGDTLSEVDGVLLPVFPELTYNYSMNGIVQVRDFSTYQPIDESYEEKLKEYFEKLKHLARERKTTVKVGSSSVTSYATMIYSDYYYNLAKSCVNTLASCMEEYRIRLTEPSSLKEIANSFPTEEIEEMVTIDDTISSIAKRLGLYEEELIYLNTDIENKISNALLNQTYKIRLNIGVTPHSIALQNDSLELTANKTYHIRNYAYNISPEDTFQSISDKYHIMVGDLIETVMEEHVLQYNAPFTVPAILYQNDTNLSREQIAAVFYERYYRPENECLEWYLSAISELNTAKDSSIPEDVILYPLTFGQLTPVRQWRKLPDDTIATVASYCAILSNPSEEFNEFKLKVHLVLGDIYQVVGNHTIRINTEVPSSFMNRLLISQNMLVQILKEADVLMPYIGVIIPEVLITTNEKETLKTFADRLELSVVELTDYVVDDKELFKMTAGNELLLIVPDLPKIEISSLIEQLLTEYSDNIAGQVSRFFLQGLRLPGPGETEDPALPSILQSMYEWTGQQFDVVMLEDTPEEDAIHLTVNKDSIANWIQLVETIISKIQLEDNGIEVSHYQLEGFTNGNHELLMNEQEEAVLEISYTKTQIISQLPAESLSPAIIKGLSPMSPYELRKLTINLGTPSNVIGTNQALRRMESLPELTAGGTPARLVEYRELSSENDTNAETNMFDVGFYTRISIKKTKTNGTYEVYGVKEEDREPLLNMSKLAANTELEPVHIMLYYVPDVTNRTDAGLCRIKKEDSTTFLLKANLSTETKHVTQATGLLNVSGNRDYGLDSVNSMYFKDTSEVSGFLRLLWECTTIGGGGYWIHLPEELPDNIFDETGTASIYLFAYRKDNRLYASDQYVLVDMSKDVVIECTEIEEKKSCLDTGEFGFELTLAPTDTDALNLSSPEDRMRQLFHIIMYQLLESDSYQGSGLSLPVFPVDKESNWWYSQIIPLYRFLNKTYHTTVGLPSLGDNPYNGVDGISATKMKINFYDILGNSTADHENYKLDVQSYYTTPILSPVDLPFLHSAYGVENNQVQTVISPDLIALTGRVATDHERKIYQDAFYQYHQKDIKVSLAGTLSKEVKKGLKEQTLDMISAVWLTLNNRKACPSYQAHEVTIKDYYTRYGITTEQLVKAIRDKTLEELFVATNQVIKVPHILTIQSSETLNKVFEESGSYVTNIATVMSMPENKKITFQSGIYLHTKVNHVTTTVNSSFSKIAKDKKTSLESLVALNQEKADIFILGTTIPYQGVSISIDQEGVRLLDICQRMEAEYNITVSPLELMVENKEKVLIQSGTMLDYDDYLSDGQSFASFEENPDIREDIITAINRNLLVTNLYENGTIITLSYLNLNQFTVEEAAKIAGCSEEYLITCNEELQLNQEVQITIEGVCMPPLDPMGHYQPYYYVNAQSFKAISDEEGILDLAVAEINKERNVLYGHGQTITIGEKTVICPVGAFSLDEILERYSNISMEELLPYLATLVRENSMWVVPSNTILGNRNTIGEIAEHLNVTPESFVECNAYLTDLLVTGQTVTIVKNQNNQYETLYQAIYEHDTFSCILKRFQKDYKEATYQDIANYNLNASMIKTNAWYFLPPRELVINQSIQDTAYEEALWEITMNMTIERDEMCVHPDFREESGYVSKVSSIPAYYELDDGGNVSYKTLANGIEKAFTHIRVVTGKRIGESKEKLYALQLLENGIRKLMVTQPVEVMIQNKKHTLPRYYAIRPLSNQLISKENMAISLYENGKLLTDTNIQNFHNIDMDIWAYQFFQDVETLLTSDYYTAIYQSAFSRANLDALVTCKKELACNVANGIDLVLNVENKESEDARKEVKKVLEQQLRNNLIKGYQIDAIAQYEVESTTGWEELAPRLDGVAYRKDNTNIQSKTVTIKSSPISLKNGVTYQHLVLTTNLPENQKQIPLKSISYHVSQLEYDRSEVSFESIGFTGEEKNNLENDNRYIRNYLEKMEVNEVEESVEDIDQYLNSSWLSFVIPFHIEASEEDNISLNYSTDVPAPVPLRLFPSIPEIKYHNTRKSMEAPKDYVKALNWDYMFSYRHEHYEQDSVHVHIEWNDAPTMALREGRGLFEELAQYMVVRDQLMSGLTGFLTNSGNEVSNEAFGTFYLLANNIKDAWGEYYESSSILITDVIDNLSYDYVIQPASPNESEDTNEDWNEGSECIHIINMTRGKESDRWPNVQIELESTGEKIDLTLKERVENTLEADYCYSSRIEVTDKMTVNLIFTDLSINQFQNAKGSVYLKRNDDIMKEQSITMNQAFIYETGKAETPSSVTPYLAYSDTFAAGKLFDKVTALGETMNSAEIENNTPDNEGKHQNMIGNTLIRQGSSYKGSDLPKVMQQLTAGSNEIGISMEIRYGLKIATVDEKPLYSYVPAFYTPSTFLESISEETVIDSCIEWWKANHLTDKEGIWQLEFTLYSKYEDKLPLCKLLLEFTN